MDRNLMIMALGMVMIAVGFIIFPIVLEGAEEVRTATNVGEYTGLSSLVKIGPTLAFVGFLFGGVVTTFFGGKGYFGGGRRKAKKSKNLR